MFSIMYNMFMPISTLSISVAIYEQSTVAIFNIFINIMYFINSKLIILLCLVQKLK